MRSYRMTSKAETSMYVQRFIADMNDMGQSHCFHTDNGGEFTSGSYVDCCDSAGIRREYTAPGELQQNTVVEKAIWCAMKGDHAARREIRRLFPAVDYAKNNEHRRKRNRLWLEAVVWAADCFNRYATENKTGWPSMYEVFITRLPSLQVVPFFQEGMMRVNRGTKSNVPCYYLNNGLNPP